MNLKEIVLASAIFLSNIVYSQDKLHFDFYSKGERFFSPKLKIGYFEKDSNGINISFLRKMYQMSSSKLNDSTYQEIISIKSLFNTRKEIFDYSFKDSCYVLDNYSAVKGEPRAERDSLEGNIFDKKYKTLLELFNDFEKGLLEDSIHFIVLAVPYSIKIEKTEKGDSLIYSGDPENLLRKSQEILLFFLILLKFMQRRTAEGLNLINFLQDLKRFGLEEGVILKEIYVRSNQFNNLFLYWTISLEVIITSESFSCQTSS